MPNIKAVYEYNRSPAALNIYLLSLLSTALLSCGPSASFSASDGAKKNDGKPGEAQTAGLEETTASSGEENGLAQPPQVITGAYLTVDCGYSDVAFTPGGERTVGCRSSDADFKTENVVATTIDPVENSHISPERDEPTGHVWDRYFVISQDRLQDPWFVLRRQAAAPGDPDLFRGKLSPLVLQPVINKFEDFARESSGGLEAKVYEVPVNTSSVPSDFSKLKLLGTFTLYNLAFAPTAFDKGFPGLPNVTEWFSLDIHTRVFIKDAGESAFEFFSDDGTRLTIDGKEIILNDGIHSPKRKAGTTTLTRGMHDVSIQYFQGPKYQIALELRWKVGTMSSFEIIPPEAFVRPLPIK
jgi:hypothetical protein